MFATLALVAAVLFVVLAFARLRASPPPLLGAVALGAAALAAVFALIHWSSVGDSRWLVGAVLIAVTLALSLARANRTLAIAAVVLGVLATALFGIASARPMQSPIAATPAD